MVDVARARAGVRTPNGMTTAEHIDASDIDLRELARSTELADVVMTHVEGTRREPVDPVSGDAVGILEMRGIVQQAEDTIQVRLGVTSEDPNASYRVEAVANFKFTGDGVSEPLLNRFARDVGAMIIYPYLRVAVYSLATQMRVPVPQLPLLRPDGVGPDSGDSD